MTTPVVSSPIAASAADAADAPAAVVAAAAAGDAHLLERAVRPCCCRSIACIWAMIAGSGCESIEATTGGVGRRRARRDLSADRDAALLEQPAELFGGPRIGVVGHLPVVGEEAGVVDQQSVERAGLGDVDVLGPAGMEELVVVARPVADDVAVDPGDPRGGDGVSQRVERRGVEHGVSVDRLRRVVVRRQHRVAAADEVEIAATTTPPLDRTAANLRREHMVRAEHLEGRGGDEQLLVARRDHRQVRVVRADLDAVELDDEARRRVERAGERVDGGGEAVVVEVAGDQPGDPAERQQRRAQHGCRSGGLPPWRRWSGAATRRSRRPARRQTATTRTGPAPGARRSRRGRSTATAPCCAGSPLSTGAALAVLGVAPQVSEGGHRPIAAGVAQPAGGPHRRRAGIVRIGDGQLAGDEDRLAGRRRSARRRPWRSGRPGVRGTRRSGPGRGRDGSDPRASSAPGSIGCRCRARSTASTASCSATSRSTSGIVSRVSPPAQSIGLPRLQRGGSSSSIGVAQVVGEVDELEVARRR